MQFFIDTGIINEIKEAASWGIINGVTTNPTLIAQTGRKQEEVITEIAGIVDGPISAEVNATDFEGMIKEGEALSKISKNVVIKVPMTIDGIKATKWFSERGIRTNVTLVFSSTQALLAAKNGATYVSPFIGRLDDCGQNGMELISEIRRIFDNYGFQTKVLSASIRTINHVKDAALVGSDVATIPFAVLKKLFFHPLTDKGVEQFVKDYKASLK